MIINNYEINTKELTTLFPPSKYIIAQRNAGCSVINLYSAMSMESYENYIKRFWAILYNTKYLIIYDDPDSTDNSLVKKAVSFAFKNGITVFFRQRNNCMEHVTPMYSELTKQTNKYVSRAGDEYEYIGSYYTEAPEQLKYKVISDRSKSKIRRFIKYYDITYPVTEYDWFIAYRQILYYHKNKIPYAYDRNLYYRCRECGDLISRGTEEEHVCYCDIVPKRMHMDYIVNGDDE